MFTHLWFIPDESDPTQLYAIAGMTNKHEWVGTSGLKQLLLMLVGLIYLLWQWQVMQRKGVQLPQHVTVESLLSYCSKREQERESGIVSEWTRGFCLPGTSEDSIILHRCHRSHRRNHVYWEGTNTGNREETQSMWCNNMMHEWDMAKWVCWANASITIWVWTILNQRFKVQTHLWS